MRVDRVPVLAADLVEEFYDLYLDAFAPLRTRAAARHVLSLSEFTEEMANPQMDKYVAIDASGKVVGLTTFTGDLASVPWIEPEYFAARYPEHAARDAIFYLGFTLVRAEAQRSRVFRTTLDSLIERVVPSRGVVAFDICAHNDLVLGLGRGIQRAMSAVVDLQMEAVDVQTYYVIETLGFRPRSGAFGST